MIVLKIFGILLGSTLIYLIIIICTSALKERNQPLSIEHDSSIAPGCRQEVSFNVDGEKISGWLYLPETGQKQVPCIILHQGFCGTKDMLLEKYALRFVDAGFAALTFDYRHFGMSQGEPRQLYSISKQLQDGKAAIGYARTRKEIDADKIFLWGTSSAGNYGILLAAGDSKIAGIIGQSLSFDHQADGKMILKREGMFWFLKLIVQAQRDKGRSRLGLSPHTFPVVGKPGTVAMFVAPGAFEGYQAIAQGSSTFKNKVCARLMFDTHGPDLLESAAKVNCPAIFHICEKDEIVAPNSYHEIEKIMGKKLSLVKNPIGHFDIYFDQWFETSIQQQIAFVKNTTSDTN